MKGTQVFETDVTISELKKIIAAIVNQRNDHPITIYIKLISRQNSHSIDPHILYIIFGSKKRRMNIVFSRTIYISFFDDVIFKPYSRAFF